MQSMPNDLEMPDLVKAMDRQIRICARLYMYLAKATIGHFGDEGERTIRQGLRGLGVWRAQEMRAAHHALGKPINMQSLTQCWDNASTFLVKDDIDSEGRFEPYDSMTLVSMFPTALRQKRGKRATSTAGDMSTAMSSIRRARQVIIRMAMWSFLST